MPLTADDIRERLHETPLDMTPAEFRAVGHQLIDRVAEFLETLPSRPVTSGLSPSELRRILGDAALPEHGAPADGIVEDAAEKLFAHSLFNGHPRFFGFITSAAAPIGALADLLAAAVNPNVGGWVLSPIASEIEARTVRWIAEFLGYPADCGGVLVSGGNMANFVGFLAARRAKAPWDIRAEGLRTGSAQMVVYASRETHTWIQKATDLFGLGLNAIRWIDVDDEQRMRMDVLERAVAADRAAGLLPFLVVGAAGSVSTGAVDPLDAIAAFCRAEDLWFHVDGAYGAPAAALPEAPPALKALAQADSVAMDPHKWLYAPIEAACTLVRDPAHLVNAFSFHPEYYVFGVPGNEPPINYHEFSMQNTRGFRALKVWMQLRQAGREGYVRMIRQDIALTRVLNEAVAAEPELEQMTSRLSICTFRYVPPRIDRRDSSSMEYLNQLNNAILLRLQEEGEVFLSNAVIDGRFALRTCIVNFRTTRADVEAVPGIVVRVGREVDASLSATA
jgi:aromatic-L-amino-acid/L-tryptophan decarboxylase